MGTHSERTGRRLPRLSPVLHRGGGRVRDRPIHLHVNVRWRSRSTNGILARRKSGGGGDRRRDDLHLPVRRFQHEGSDEGARSCLRRAHHVHAVVGDGASNASAQRRDGPRRDGCSSVLFV